MWIARDKSDQLWLYSDEPIKHIINYQCRNAGEPVMLLDSKLFPEVTFESGPIEVEFKIK